MELAVRVRKCQRHPANSFWRGPRRVLCIRNPVPRTGFSRFQRPPTRAKRRLKEMAIRLEKSRKPLRLSQTVVPAKQAFDPDEWWSSGSGRRVAARRVPVVKGQVVRAVVEPDPAQSLPRSAATRLRLQPLVAEWLLEVRVMGRSHRTIGCDQQKMSQYLENEGGPQTWTGSPLPSSSGCWRASRSASSRPLPSTKRPLHPPAQSAHA
jgi:hypothetical protein